MSTPGTVTPPPQDPAENSEQTPPPGRAITREQINLLPVVPYEGPIRLVTRPEDISEVVRSLREETLLGFDIETKPAFKRGENYPPALLQLAGENLVYVFQLHQLNGLDGLSEILADQGIVKAGVALADDLKKLRALTPFEPAGFIEIAHLARKAGIHQTGLRSLAGLLLGIRISKREQRSNWARPTLSSGQITYAATDAWISRRIYLALTQELESAS